MIKKTCSSIQILVYSKQRSIIATKQHSLRTISNNILLLCKFGKSIETFKIMKQKQGKGISLVEITSFVIFCLVSILTTEASPTLLTSSSGIFSYPSYPSRYSPATSVTWVIKVDEGKHINLTLHVIDVEAYRGKCVDIVEIKDGNNSESPLLGGYCNSHKPNYSILSSSNALRVWFQSANNSDGGLGFNVSYTSVNNEACGGKLDSFPGTITTPRYPLPYPNNRNCSWKIVAPRGVYIHMEFHGVYSLDYLCSYRECECRDILDIKDGKKPLPHVPFYGYCIAKPWPFTSKTNEVSLKFVSDDAGRFEGFMARYTTSLTKDCGADLWNDHGLITSPNYPYSYHSYRTCIWRIMVPDNHYVIITFHEFDIKKSHHACFVDYLAIYDGYTKTSPLLAKLCNSNFVSKVNSTGNKVYFKFRSGFNLKAKGFKATYASYKRGNSRKRQPRHNKMEISGFSQKKALNIATKKTASFCMKAFVILGILGSYL